MDDSAKKYDCYNDPNYTEEGLKKCKHQFKRHWMFSPCYHCNNEPYCPNGYQDIYFSTLKTLKEIEVASLDNQTPYTITFEPDHVEIEVEDDSDEIWWPF